MDNVEQARILAIELRNFLEGEWKAFRKERDRPTPDIVSTGMCRLSAPVVASAMMECIGGKWSVLGGVPRLEDAENTSGRMNGGMMDTSGKWNGHYWVVGPNGIVVDVTADQFGYQAVEVTDSDDNRYHANYKKAALIQHLKDVNWRSGTWLENWNTFRASKTMEIKL